MGNHQREIAGIFVGASCLLLIWQGRYDVAAGLLGGMMGFFVGEKNGEKRAKTTEKS